MRTTGSLLLERPCASARAGARSGGGGLGEAGMVNLGNDCRSSKAQSTKHKAQSSPHPPFGHLPPQAGEEGHSPSHRPQPKPQATAQATGHSPSHRPQPKPQATAQAKAKGRSQRPKPKAEAKAKAKAKAKGPSFLLPNRRNTKGAPRPLPDHHISAAAYLPRFIVALLWPVATERSPANGFSLRIIHGYFGQLPASHGCSGWFSCSTRRASSARVLLPRLV